MKWHSFYFFCQFYFFKYTYSIPGLHFWKGHMNKGMWSDRLRCRIASYCSSFSKSILAFRACKYEKVSTKTWLAYSFWWTTPTKMIESRKYSAYRKGEILLLLLFSNYEGFWQEIIKRNKKCNLMLGKYLGNKEMYRLYCFLESQIYKMSFFMTFLDPPELSRCLNNVQQVKYDSTLTIECYAPGNPVPNVACELWGENDTVLQRLGKCCYIFHINGHKELVSKNEPFLLVSSVPTLINEVF